MQNDSPRCRILLCVVKFSLNACKVIVVMVNSLRRCKIFLLDINRGIADTVALCPLFMALYAR